jgi:hypothetical protein
MNLKIVVAPGSKLHIFFTGISGTICASVFPMFPASDSHTHRSLIYLPPACRIGTMGKNWSGRGGGRGGGGGGGNDLSNCRGYAAVIGTCDAAREKESNKELTNLLSQAIERLYPRHDTQLHQEGSANKEDSIADLLQNELKQLQKQKHSGAQDVVSINIGIKGIVFAKITRRDVCPVKLVKDILDQVKTEKVPCSRHLVKVVPLQLVTFGGETEFISSAKILVEGHFGAETTGEGSTLAQIALSKVVHKRKADDLDGEIHECDDAGESAQKRVCVEESVPSSSTRLRSGSNAQEEDSVGDDTAEVGLHSDPAPPTVDESAQESSTAVQVPAAPAAVLPEVRYFVLFKARNHNTLNKQLVIQRVKEEMPAHLRQDYLHGQVGS